MIAAVIATVLLQSAAASFDVQKVIGSLTVEEKVALLVGVSSKGSASAGDVGLLEKGNIGAAGATHAVPRLGVPSIILADGPAGLRIKPVREGEDRTYYCTGFPIGLAMSSTWNPGIVSEVGAAMGNEVLEYGVDVLLAPGINILRNPLCGRNFEYYSEDPLLAGETAAAFISGIQSQGVGTSLKHFACNNQEVNRLSNDSVVSERALHEIYLRNFEIAVRKAQPWTIMTSYNFINGTHATECRWMLEDLLRGEWGFEGCVMTDWGGGYDMAAAVAAGNDMVQPGSDKHYKAILDAVSSGRLKEDELDRSVRRVLELVARSPKSRGYVHSDAPDLEAHAAVARKAAREGVVLLKRGCLPLETGKTVALFGVGSYDFIAGGTGSGDVNRPYVVDLKEGLENAGFVLETSVDAFYDEYMAVERKRCARMNKGLKWYIPHEAAIEVTPESVLASSAGSADAAIVTFSRISGEGKDRLEGKDFCLSADEKALLEAVSKAFHSAGKKVVVVLNVCGAVEVASWRGMADDILICWLPGEEGGNAVADIICGADNPSGRLPMTLPVNYSDDPSSADFPQVLVDKPFNYSFYRNFADGSLRRDVRNVDYTNYGEGIYVGYRHYVTRRVKVAYPFGYGLSYTEFSWGRLTVEEAEGGWNLRMSVRNTGTRPGRDVVELYVSAPSGGLDKPSRELKGFAKTKLLEVGETEEVCIFVPSDALASYDEGAHSWVTAEGRYRFIAARNVNDPVRKAGLRICSTK